MPWTRFVAVLVILSFLSGCTGYRNVSIDGAQGSAPVSLQNVVPGDHARVTLKSGDVRAFFITEIEADRILGAGEDHAFSDIERLEVRRVQRDLNNQVIGVIVVASLVAILSSGGSGD